MTAAWPICDDIETKKTVAAKPAAQNATNTHCSAGEAPRTAYVEGTRSLSRFGIVLPLNSIACIDLRRRDAALRAGAM
jgi:hypothetical protein